MTEPTDINRFDPNNPAVQILLLAQRVENLGKEKEGIERDLERERAERENSEKETSIREKNLEERIAKIEGSLGKGAGILIGLATVGSIGGVLMAWGKTIFAPWMGK